MKDLVEITETHEKMSNDEIAAALADTLDKRVLLLKIISTNRYELEENSRMELIVEFKTSYGNALRQVMAMLTKFRADMDLEKRQNFIYTFFPFMFGIYPYTNVTEKQKQAMAQAGVDYKFNSLYDLTYNAVRGMLTN